MAEQRKAEVVDLAAFRAARDRQRLPLLDAAEAPAQSPFRGAPDEAAVLTDRQTEHRARMLRHLGGSRKLRSCPT